MPRCRYNITYEKANKEGPGLMQCPHNAAGTVGIENVCWNCANKYQLVFDTQYISSSEPLTFAKFSETNRKRCETPAPNGFGESLAPGSKYDAEYFSMAAGEEMGEVIGAVLGAEGKKVRKKHLTKDDILDEIGDVVACLDLLAQKYGSTVGECVLIKFNKVSDRLGSNIKL